MRTGKKFFVAAVLGLSLLGGAFSPQASAEVVVSGTITLPDAVGNSVRIQDKYGTAFGSGFFVKGDRVVTNYHVTKYAKEYAVDGLTFALDGNGNKYSMELIAFDKDADLAVYQTDAKGHDYFSIADSEGNGVFKSVVNSMSQRFETLEGGVVERSQINTTKIFDGSEIVRNRLVLSYHSRGGNSGSPVLDEYNRVVGVVMGSALEGSTVPVGSAVAVKLEDVKMVLAKAE